MVRDVPAGMEDPTDCDGPIIMQSSVGKQGNNGTEAELPKPEATTEVSGSGARQKYGAESLPCRLGNE